MQKSNFKKIIFFLNLSSIFILFFNTKALSQLEIGVKGGLSFNSVNNHSFFFESENMSHNVFENNNGYRFGFYTKIKLLKSLSKALFKSDGAFSIFLPLAITTSPIK